MITNDGRTAVESTGAAGYPWKPAALKNLNEEPDDINERPCLVTFMDKDCCSAEKKQGMVEMLAEVAEEFRDALSFFYVVEEGDVSNQIRGMIEGDGCPLVAIVDIPDNGGYYLAGSIDLTADNIRAFATGFVNKTLERKQMVA